MIDQGRTSFLDELVNHPAGKKIHSHALRFGNTTDTIINFWQQIINKQFTPIMSDQISQSLEYLETHGNILIDSLKEVAQYLPSDIQLDCKLYTMAGYDIGIVSEGSAFLNIAHPLFKSNHCELIFMAMHEVHHVGYVHYNPIFALSDIDRLSDLKHAIRYLTHLEGLAVYTPLAKRLETDCQRHEDYEALLDDHIVEQRFNEYTSLVSELEKKEDRAIKELDFSIFEPMTVKGKRLWYVAGAFMAKKIDEELGREALNSTIKSGPDNFFALFNSI